MSTITVSEQTKQDLEAAAEKAGLGLEAFLRNVAGGGPQTLERRPEGEGPATHRDHDPDADFDRKFDEFLEAVHAVRDEPEAVPQPDPRPWKREVHDAIADDHERIRAGYSTPEWRELKAQQVDEADG